MSDKNFMSYGDAETVLTEYAEAIKDASSKLVPSVSYYQTGTISTGTITAGDSVELSVTLATTMPDKDYVVIINKPIGSLALSYMVGEKTTTGFTVVLMRTADTDLSGTNIQYQAFKLMTDESRALDEAAIAQNAADIADIQAVIPSGASSSNQLVTANKSMAKTTFTYANRTLNANSDDEQTFDFDNGTYTLAGLVSAMPQNASLTIYAYKFDEAGGGDGTLHIDKMSTSYAYVFNISHDGVVKTNTLVGGTWRGWKTSLTTSDLTSSVTSGSTAPVTSGGCYSTLFSQNTNKRVVTENDTVIDGSTNYANNVGRIQSRNAVSTVSNPSTGYQWPVTNTRSDNVFFSVGNAIQFFVDTANYKIYMRAKNSTDMGVWFALN